MRNPHFLRTRRTTTSLLHLHPTSAATAHPTPPTTPADRAPDHQAGAVTAADLAERCCCHAGAIAAADLAERRCCHAGAITAADLAERRCCHAGAITAADLAERRCRRTGAIAAADLAERRCRRTGTIAAAGLEARHRLRAGTVAAPDLEERRRRKLGRTPRHETARSRASPQIRCWPGADAPCQDFFISLGSNPAAALRTETIGTETIGTKTIGTEAAGTELAAVVAIPAPGTTPKTAAGPGTKNQPAPDPDQTKPEGQTRSAGRTFAIKNVYRDDDGTLYAAAADLEDFPGTNRHQPGANAPH